MTRPVRPVPRSSWKAPVLQGCVMKLDSSSWTKRTMRPSPPTPAKDRYSAAPTLSPATLCGCPTLRRQHRIRLAGPSGRDERLSNEQSRQKFSLPGRGRSLADSAAETSRYGVRPDPVPRQGHHSRTCRAPMPPCSSGSVVPIQPSSVICRQTPMSKSGCLNLRARIRLRSPPRGATAAALARTIFT